MKVQLINSPIKEKYGENLLHSRGIENVDSFLLPGGDALQSWQDLINIEQGVQLISKLEPNSTIGIIVDSDVDGFTSAAIIGQYIQRLNGSFNIYYYLHEGKQHGFEDKWEELLDENYDLIIAPDAASNDKEYIKKFNCPVLVIDHHIVEDVNFPANMVVINNQISPKYKNKNLSGAGMAYQFCRALDSAFGFEWADDYIDLAALGVCGDMMSGLEIENQYLWHRGFANIKNYFFLSLLKKQAFSITGNAYANELDIIDALNPMSVAFYIVPLINAMVRVGTQEEKGRMMLAFVDGHKKVPSLKRGAKGTYEEVAIESVRECINARTHQNKFKEDAVMRLEQKIFKHDLLENKILFVRLDDDDIFPSELNGLIAMQLSQRYKRPTIVARLNEEGYIRGSARGLSNCELESFKNYLDSTGLFEYAQGHDNAFGLSIKNSDLDKLHQQANADLAKYNFGEDYYEVDFERQALDKDLVNLIDDLDRYKFCWSTGNPEPLIYIKDLHFTKKDLQIMGRNKDTIKIIKNGVSYIKFFAKDLIEEIDSIKGDNIKIEVVGKTKMNEWMNKVTPQILIEQIEIKEDKKTDF